MCYQCIVCGAHVCWCNVFAEQCLLFEVMSMFWCCSFMCLLFEVVFYVHLCNFIKNLTHMPSLILRITLSIRFTDSFVTMILIWFSIFACNFKQQRRLGRKQSAANRSKTHQNNNCIQHNKEQKLSRKCSIVNRIEGEHE